MQEIGLDRTMGVFDVLHGHTALCTDSERFLTYNILADLYAFRDIADYTPYCNPEHLELSYRQNILIDELKGYNCDILCLQEVDEVTYNGRLTQELRQEGFEGLFLKKYGKHGELSEGSTLYYRKSKFRLIHQEGNSLAKLLESETFCDDIKRWVYSNPSWKSAIEIQPHTAQITVLECINDGRAVIVCNTHLLWDESKPVVRFVQVLVTVRLLGQIRQKYNSKKPGLIYCGDFNSRPEEAVIKYILKQDLCPSHLDEDKQSDTQCSDTEWLPEQDLFPNDLNLGNACGVRPYTCLTGIFRGHLDYIFYDLDRFDVTKVIPQLSDSLVTKHTAMPNKEIPSDHLPQICEFKFR